MKNNVIKYLINQTDQFDMLRLVLKSSGGAVRFVDKPFVFTMDDVSYMVIEMFYEHGGIHIVYGRVVNGNIEAMFSDHMDDVSISEDDYHALFSFVCNLVCGTDSLELMLVDWFVGTFPLKSAINKYSEKELGEYAIAFEEYIEGCKKLVSNLHNE